MHGGVGGKQHKTLSANSFVNFDPSKLTEHCVCSHEQGCKMNETEKRNKKKKHYKEVINGFVQLVKRREQVAARHLSYFPRGGIDWINTRAVLSHCKQGRVPLFSE